MVSREFRSFLPRTLNTSRRSAQDRAGTHALLGLKSPGRFAAMLASRVGKALGVGGVESSIQRLEDRTLLDGSPTNPLVLTAGTEGRFTGVQTISSPTDADYWEFIAPANAFVSALADTSNEANRNLDSSVRVLLGSTGAVVATGENNGSLTSGFQKDGWVGFNATQGTRYIIEVRGQTASTGPYTLRMRGTNFTFSVGGQDLTVNPPIDRGIGFETGTPAPDITPFGAIAPTPILGQLGGTGALNTRTRQDEMIYRWTAPTNSLYNTLVTVNAQSTDQTNLTQRLDTHLDIYDSNGNLIISDQQSGRINDAALAFKATAGATYFIRVRSDEVSNANRALATGPFFLVFDAQPEVLQLDKISRRGTAGGSLVAFQEPLQQPSPNMPDPVFQTASWKFKAEGSGLAIVTVTGAPLNPMQNPAVSLYNSAGTRVAFADDTFGLIPQLEVQLVGGQEYYIVVDGFEIQGGTDYVFFVEANHTIDNTIDDHPDLTGATLTDARRNASEATALPWSNPFTFNDADGNPLRDRGLRVSANGSGRLQQGGDTDLFQFTPPVDMLMDYDGNNDDNGTSLYLGGGFDIQGRGKSFPNYSRGMVGFDGGDVFTTGKQNVVILNGVPVQQGFVDNPATPDTNGPVIFTSYDWQPFTNETNTLPRRLVVGGDFIYQEVVNGQIVQVTNLLAWQLIGGRYQWNRGQGPQFLGSVDGPVYALIQYNPSAFDPDDSDPLPTIPDPGIPSLFVGGDFDTPGDNLAAFNPADGWFEPPVNPDVAATEVASGPVRAFAIYDAQDAGDGREAQDNEPPDPDLDAVPDPGNPPQALYIGGSFNQGLIGWNGANRFTLSVGSEPVDINGDPTGDGTPPPVGNIDGSVYSLAVYTIDLDNYLDSDGTNLDPSGDPVGGNTNDAPVEMLFIGGDFTGRDGFDSPGLLAWGARRSVLNGELNDTELVEYSPALEFADLGLPIFGTVHALQPWTPAQLNVSTGTPTEFLAMGGAFTSGDFANLALFAPNSHLALELTGALSVGTNGPVYTLATFQDDDEPLQENDLDSGSANSTLYVGGAFTQVVFDDGTTMATSNIAYLNAVTGDGALPDDSFSWGALPEGVQYETDVPGRTASVRTLAAFDDGLAGTWDRNDRPATRLALELTGAFADQADFTIRILDSNFNEVFPGQGGQALGVSNLEEPPGDGDPDNPGMRDPSIGRTNRVTGYDGIPLVGGQVYYLSIEGTGTGRYDFTITADSGARRVKLNRDGTLTEDQSFPLADINTTLPGVPLAFGGNDTQITNTFASEQSREGDFNAGIRRLLDAFGDSDLLVDRAGGTSLTEMRHLREKPSERTASMLRGGQGIISDINDTDLYFFRAASTGFAEVRLSTAAIADNFQQTEIDYRLSYPPIAGNGATVITDVPTPIPAYESNLDGAIRVFGNDFSQVAYNDDNPAFQYSIPGDRMLSRLAADAQGNAVAYEFNQRDSRVVFPVVADNVYFIQVESGQRWRVANPPEFYDNVPDATDPRVANTDPDIDWRYAIGSYQLIFNTMTQQFSDLENGQVVLDDHGDVLATNQFAPYLATPIPIGSDPQNSGSNGVGVATGFINNTPNKPNDIDLFKFSNPGKGNVIVTLSRADGSTLTATLAVFREGPQNVGDATNLGNGRLQINTTSFNGEEFFVQITGVAASEGGYRIDIQTLPFVDDYSDKFRWWEATNISLEDASGIGFIAGNIEVPGDSDVFKFQFPDYDLINVTVRALDNSLVPRVTVYEISENPLGNGSITHPFYLQIASTSRTEAPPVGTTEVTVRASVSPDRSTSFAPPNDRSYPNYFIVVEGFDPTTDAGRYELTINFASTDDHADAVPLAGDVTYNISQLAFATNVTIDAITGQGSRAGNIEVSSDTDLFTFESPASGPVSVNLTRALGSTFRGRVSIMDAAGNLLGTRGVLGDNTSTSPVTATVPFVARGTRLYIVVDPVSPNVNTTLIGTYSISVQTPSVDDHANRSEYSLATPIAIVASTGRGQLGGSSVGVNNPRINTSADTDLFYFFNIATGSHTVQVAPLSATSAGLRPRIEIYQAVFNSQGTEIAQNLVGSADAANVLDPVTFTFNVSSLLSKYYVLVVPLAGSADTGEYRISIQGPIPDVLPPGTDTGEIDFNAPTTIVLNDRTGDGSTLRQGSRPQLPEINPSGDRDLYSFTTVAPGRVFIRLSLPDGSTLLGRMDVYRRNQDTSISLIGSDEVNNFGSAAKFDFAAPAGQTIFVVVDAPGDSTGSYTLEVDTQPLVNQLVYPEGYATNLISEFIPIVNPNPFPINYTVKLYYSFEDGNGGRLVDTFSTRTIGANTRDGVTINAPINGSIVQDGPVRQNVPYSLVVEYQYPNTFVNTQGQTVAVDPANIQPLGATLSHYDFGSSTGDAFTSRVSDRWAFPRLERAPGSTLNYVVVWNPHDFAVDMQLVAYLQNGQQITLPGNGEYRRIEANRREGFGIDDFAQLGTGIFSAVLTARVAPESNGSTDPAKAAVFEGVVAAVSAYRIGAGQEAAFGAIGDADMGSRKGAITNLTQGNGVTSEIVIFNPSNNPASVTLNSKFIRTGITGFSRVIQVGPGRSTVVNASTLGITPGQPVGITYTSNIDVSVQSVEFQRGDADSASPRYTAGTRFLFGDAFIDARTAGRLYFETLWVYNPTNTVSTIDIKLNFYNRPSQPTSTISINVPANGFSELRLHERSEILSSGGPTWFAVDATSRNNLPFMMTMEHYDLFLGGGWAASGVPYGIQVPLEQIR